MNRKKTVLYMYLFISIVAIMVGCNSKLNDEKQVQLSLINQTNPTPINLMSQPTKGSSSKNIKEDVQSIDSIYDVAVIRGKDKTLVAYKVKHLKRFHMKAIEKEVNCYTGGKVSRRRFYCFQRLQNLFRSYSIRREIERS